MTPVRKAVEALRGVDSQGQSETVQDQLPRRAGTGRLAPLLTGPDAATPGGDRARGWCHWPVRRADPRPAAGQTDDIHVPPTATPGSEPSAEHEPSQPNAPSLLPSLITTDASAENPEPPNPTQSVTWTFGWAVRALPPVFPRRTTKDQELSARSRRTLAGLATGRGV